MENVEYLVTCVVFISTFEISDSRSIGETRGSQTSRFNLLKTIFANDVIFIACVADNLAKSPFETRPAGTQAIYLWILGGTHVRTCVYGRYFRKLNCETVWEETSLHVAVPPAWGLYIEIIPLAFTLSS